MSATAWIAAADAPARGLTAADIRRLALAGKLAARWPDGEAIDRFAFMDAKVLDDGRVTFSTRDAAGGFIWSLPRAFELAAGAVDKLAVRPAAPTPMNLPENRALAALAEALAAATKPALEKIEAGQAATTAELRGIAEGLRAESVPVRLDRETVAEIGAETSAALAKVMAPKETTAPKKAAGPDRTALAAEAKAFVESAAAEGLPGFDRRTLAKGIMRKLYRELKAEETDAFVDEFVQAHGGGRNEGLDEEKTFAYARKALDGFRANRLTLKAENLKAKPATKGS